jgi:hypothetical protein
MTASFIANVQVSSEVTRMGDGKVLGSYFFPDEVLKANLDPLTVNIADNENFINPQRITLDQMLSYSKNIYSLSGVSPNTTVISANANNLVAQTEYFIKHTVRLSGNIKIGTPDSIERDRQVPHLVNLSSLGKTNTYIKYVQTGTYDDSEMNDMYGSLFIDLSANVAALNTYYTQISSNLEIQFPGTEAQLIIQDLSTQDASNIANNLYIIESYIRDNRLEDEDKYNEMLKNSTKFSYNITRMASLAQANMANQFTTF